MSNEQNVYLRFDASRFALLFHQELTTKHHRYHINPRLRLLLLSTLTVLVTPLSLPPSLVNQLLTDFERGRGREQLQTMQGEVSEADRRWPLTC